MKIKKFDLYIDMLLEIWGGNSIYNEDGDWKSPIIFIGNWGGDEE